METTWVCSWFQRLLDHVTKNTNNKDTCPVS